MEQSQPYRQQMPTNQVKVQDFGYNTNERSEESSYNQTQNNKQPHGNYVVPNNNVQATQPIQQSQPYRPQTTVSSQVKTRVIIENSTPENNYNANNGVSDYGSNYLQTSTVGEDTDENSDINQVDANAGTGVSSQTQP